MITMFTLPPDNICRYSKPSNWIATKLLLSLHESNATTLGMIAQALQSNQRVPSILAQGSGLPIYGRVYLESRGPTMKRCKTG